MCSWYQSLTSCSFCSSWSASLPITARDRATLACSCMSRLKVTCRKKQQYSRTRTEAERNSLLHSVALAMVVLIVMELCEVCGGPPDLYDHVCINFICRNTARASKKRHRQVVAVFVLNTIPQLPAEQRANVLLVANAEALVPAQVQATCQHLQEHRV